MAVQPARLCLRQTRYISALHVPPLLFAVWQTGEACTMPYICTEQLSQAAPALYLKLPYLAGQPFNTVFVLPRKVIHFLYGVVDLLHARAHFIHRVFDFCR